jgi:hypothetical protein
MVADSDSSSWLAPTRVQDFWDQMLALADEIGAATAETHQQVRDAFAEATLAPSSQPGAVGGWAAAADPSRLLEPSALADQVSSTTDRILQLSDAFADMSIGVAVAYVDAWTRAVVAAADCHEQLAAAGDVEPLKTAGAARAQLLRTVATASAATLRDLIS